MKCINCNNEIQDGLTVCPNCGVSLNNLESTAVLPTTPEAPVLPQDQGMVTQELQTQVIPEEPVTEAIPTVVAPPEVVQQPVQVQVQEQPMVNNVPTFELPQSEVAVTQDQMVNTPEAHQVLENAINPAFIDPKGDKLKTLSPEELAEKKKKKLILTLIILAIIVVAVGLGVFYYITQYKTASKRLNTIFKEATIFTTRLNDEMINNASGTFTANIGYSYNDTNINSNFSGTYASNIKSRIADLNVKVDEYTNKDKLLNDPLEFEFYYNNSKTYTLLKSMYDNYIFEDNYNFDEFYDIYAKKDIKYMTLINSYKSAVSKSIDSLNTKQSVGNVTIHGNSTKANIVTIRMDGVNQKRFYFMLYRTLANDNQFITELAKIKGKDAEFVKDEYNKLVEEFEVNPAISTIEVYTSTFSKEFIGIKVNTEKGELRTYLEIYPVESGYGITYKEGEQSIFEGTFVDNRKVSADKREHEYNVNVIYYKDGIAYKVSAEGNLVSDINAKDATVNVKNSVSRDYLTDEDWASINENYSKLGDLYLKYPDLVDKLLDIGDLPNKHPHQYDKLLLR